MIYVAFAAGFLAGVVTMVAASLLLVRHKLRGLRA